MPPRRTVYNPTAHGAPTGPTGPADPMYQWRYGMSQDEKENFGYAGQFPGASPSQTPNERQRAAAQYLFTQNHPLLQNVLPAVDRVEGFLGQFGPNVPFGATPGEIAAGQAGREGALYPPRPAAMPVPDSSAAMPPPVRMPRGPNVSVTRPNQTVPPSIVPGPSFLQDGGGQNTRAAEPFRPGSSGGLGADEGNVVDNLPVSRTVNDLIAPSPRPTTHVNLPSNTTFRPVKPQPQPTPHTPMQTPLNSSELGTTNPFQGYQGGGGATGPGNYGGGTPTVDQQNWAQSLWAPQNQNLPQAYQAPAAPPAANPTRTIQPVQPAGARPGPLPVRTGPATTPPSSVPKAPLPGQPSAPPAGAAPSTPANSPVRGGMPFRGGRLDLD